MEGQGNTNGNTGNGQDVSNPLNPTSTPVSNPSIPPAPGTIPRQTIKIADAIEAAKQNASETTSTIRTFQSDIAGTVKNDNLSMIKISLAEKARQEEQGDGYAELPKTGPRLKVAYLLTFLLVLVIGGMVTGLYFYFNKPLPPTVRETVAPNEPEILYSEDQVAVSIDDKYRDQLLNELKPHVFADIDLGVIKRVFLVTGQGSSTRNTTTRDLFTILGFRAGESLLSGLADNYVLGSYSRDPHETFLLLRVTSYDSAFAGMLAWEPYMDYDIGPLLYKPAPQVQPPTQTVINTPIDPVISGTSSASSSQTASSTTIVASGTSSTPIVPPPTIVTPTFKDRVMQNKDVRALIDSEGKIRFIYSFLDTSTLIIASSERALKEVQARVTTGRIRR